MAINKKLIHFTNKVNFLNEYNKGNILPTSIVFIQDAKQIWTHEEFYSCPFTEEEINQLLVGSKVTLAGYTEIESPVDINDADTVNSAFGKIEDYLNSIDESISNKLSKTEAAENYQVKGDYITKTEVANSYQVKGDYALKSDLEASIPTKVSQLENDVPYVVDNTLPANGLYIYDINGNFTLPDNWNTSNNIKAVGVAILTDDCRFVVAKEDISTIHWGGYGTDISTLTNYTSDTDAATDFDGVNNTAKIIAAIGNSNDGYRGGTVAGDCAAYTFPNGKTGYLGAAGEWQLARSYKDELNSALELIGGTKMAEGGYWTSTEYSNNRAWTQGFGSNSYLDYYRKDRNYHYVRAFLAIEVSKPLKEKVSELEQNYFKWSKLILHSFTIAGVSYDFEEGMTWEDWVNSEYNTGGFYFGTIITDYVYNRDTTLKVMEASRNINIIANYEYSLEPQKK